MEKEITTTNQATALADSLIVVQQLPIIKEQLHSIKAQAQESVKEALSLACTEETLKVVKERRAALNRDRKDLDARRMAVKKQIMQPFEDFDEVYKECVTDVYGPADEALKEKIVAVENGLKTDKEKKVKDYFAEMVKASGVEWVTYEDVGVAVTLTASLKSLKAKVKEYVEKVAADVACINGMENAPEIMAEYKLCGSLAVAINSVSQRKDRIAREEAERKQRLEAQLRAQEAEKAVLDDLYLIESNYRDEDIDYIVGMMCYLQMSLLGMPGYVVIGDTLASPSVSYDKRGLLPVDKGNVWYTPLLRIPVWQYRIFMAQMELVTQPIKEECAADAPKPEPQKSPEAPRKLEKPKNTEKPKAAKKPQRAPEQEPVFSEGKGGQLSFF